MVHVNKSVRLLVRFYFHFHQVFPTFFVSMAWDLAVLAQHAGNIMKMMIQNVLVQSYLQRITLGDFLIFYSQHPF